MRYNEERKGKNKIMKKLYQITDEGKKELEVELDELKSRRGAIAD